MDGLDWGGWVGGGGDSVDEGATSTSARITPTPHGLDWREPPTSCRRCRCAKPTRGRLVGGVGQISTCTKRTAPHLSHQVHRFCLAAGCDAMRCCLTSDESDGRTAPAKPQANITTHAMVPQVQGVLRVPPSVFNACRPRSWIFSQVRRPVAHDDR